MSSTAQTAEGEKILIVDDDPGLSSLLERFFNSKGYRARAVPNTEQMDRLLGREVFNLVVLDLMLPRRRRPYRLQTLARCEQPDPHHHADRQGR
ncbi:DNA-binding response OmpR family regulator [Pseudomonas sp. W3I7]|nr:DNA-binding response OmpR family regulator [Pseudomonas sp. W3I7]